MHIRSLSSKSTNSAYLPPLRNKIFQLRAYLKSSRPGLCSPIFFFSFSLHFKFSSSVSCVFLSYSKCIQFKCRTTQNCFLSNLGVPNKQSALRLEYHLNIKAALNMTQNTFVCRTKLRVEAGQCYTA